MLPSMVAGSFTVCPVRGESFGSAFGNGRLRLDRQRLGLRLAGRRVEQNKDAIVSAQRQLLAIGTNAETQGRFRLPVVDLAFDHACGVPRLDSAIFADEYSVLPSAV